MTEASVFSPRVLLGWVAAIAAAFAFSIYFMGAGGDGDEAAPDTIGPSALSRSAIGYAGLAETLQRLGLPVVRRNGGHDEKLGPGSVVIVAEPQPSAEAEENGFALGKATGVVFVLPKWRGIPSRSHDGWIDDVDPLPTGNADWTLARAGAEGRAVRVALPAAWSVNTLGPAPTLGPAVQLIADSDLTPIIAADEGILVGETEQRGRRVVVVADPDILSNQGLLKGENARLALRLIGELHNGSGKIVFDTTVRGTAAGGGAPKLDLLLLFFRFPFVWVTALALAAIALLLWAAMPRFGKPETTPDLIDAGKRPLIRNVSNLLEFAGHQEVVVGGYIQSTLRSVARRLHAPKDLGGAALVDWLHRTGRARGIATDLPGIMARIAERPAGLAPDRAALIRATVDIHRWKQEILNGA
jgi:hypothetical protein